MEGVADADEDDLYAAMDWLIGRQGGRSRSGLARRHLKDGGLVLFDLTSSYFEGVTCPLAKLGYSRDGKPGTLQVNWGLLTDEREATRWRCRCSRAIPAIPRRCCPRSRS